MCYGLSNNATQRMKYLYCFYNSLRIITISNSTTKSSIIYCYIAKIDKEMQIDVQLLNFHNKNICIFMIRWLISSSFYPEYFFKTTVYRDQKLFKTIYMKKYLSINLQHLNLEKKKMSERNFHKFYLNWYSKTNSLI